MFIKIYFFALILLISTYFSPDSFAQTSNEPVYTGCGSKLFSRNKLIESEKAYKERNFEIAESLARTALECDPSSDTAQLFVARIVRVQFKPGVNSPENLAKGQQAIDEYKKVLFIFETVLISDSENKRARKYAEESFRQIAALFEAIKKEDELNDWLMQRATNESASPSLRAESYIFLASKQFQCSNNITEANKKEIRKKGNLFFIYVKPKVVADLEKATKCVQTGLELIQKGLDLNVNNEIAWTYKANLLNEIAWSYKANLLLEQSRFAEMLGDSEKVKQIKLKIDEAFKKYMELADERRERQKAEDQKIEAENN